MAEPSRTPDDGAVGPTEHAARARRSTVMSKVWVGFVCLLVLLFAGFALNASVALVRAPQPLAKAIGVGVILVVLVTVAVLAREVWFGRQTERLADQLEAEGGQLLGERRSHGLDLALHVGDEVLRRRAGSDGDEFPAVLAPGIQDLLGGVGQKRHGGVFPFSHGAILP